MTVPRRLRADEGMSLVEILVAVVLLGIGVVGLLSALMFAFTAADRHRQLAQNNTLATQAMEVVADPLQTPFAACGGAVASYQAVARAQVAPAITVLSVQEWGSSGWQACGTPVLPLQQIRITAPSPDGTGNVTMAVVKRGDS